MRARGCGSGDGGAAGAAVETIPQRSRLGARGVFVPIAQLVEHAGDEVDELILVFDVDDPTGDVFEGILVEAREDLRTRRGGLILRRQRASTRASWRDVAARANARDKATRRALIGPRDRVDRGCS